ncbi:four-carbon acid sugar kinase family protein [Solicola sp. PLA-1-18]|uniref:four-carbon acid sugar kinase family protein n=1 Tax=Solicola sp. PLA-1-18 TaxID=3380532 RepID=UPI003B7DC5CD
MTARVVVLADDLTGAGDTAAQFDRVGWTSEIRLRPSATTDAEVVALTTDSRAMDAADATAAVGSTLDALDLDGVLLYKKVDSTVRGPVRAEIDAVLAALPPGTVAVVCPAYPAVGRQVVDGVLLVGGVPVSATAVGRDPVTPVRESHVPTLLGTSHLTPDPAWSDDDLAAELTRHGDVVVVDAADEEDLDRLARALVLLGERAVAVGSAGLAEPLARRWRVSHAVGTSLVVVTSLHDASRDQAETLAITGAPVVRCEADAVADDQAWERLVAGALHDVSTDGPPVALVTTPDAAAGLDPVLVAARVADLVTRLAAKGLVSGLVLAGGDGARAVLEGLGADGIRLDGTVATGVPLGRLVGGDHAGMRVATKAGGFGGPDILIEAAQAVHTTRSSS